MKIKERHAKILELLTHHKKVEVTQLSELLQVSQVTIRKDLDQLENKGLIVRSHGFATLNSSDDINNRLANQYDKKQQIAKIACQDIQDGETVMIESGSCCALLALEIAHTKKDVTIITNSAFIAEFIRKEGHNRIILLGGEYQKGSQVNVGPLVRKCVESFFVDKLFIGIDGFSIETGFTGNDLMRSEAVQDMVKQVKTVIVMTDSSKFYHVSTVHLLNVEQVKMIVTDCDAPRDIVDYFKESNVDIKQTERKRNMF